MSDVAKSLVVGVEIDDSKARSGGENVDTILAQMREQIRAAKDDTAAYTAWLEKNTAAQVANAEAATAAAEAAEKIGLQYREHIAASQALKEAGIDLAGYTQDSANPAMAEWSKKTEEAGEQAEHLGLKQRELHRLFAEINHILPGTGELLRAVFHPSLFTASIAAIGGVVAGFEVYQKRVEEASKAFGAVELPDFSDVYVNHIANGADAWERYAEALKKGREAFNAPDAVAQRRIDKINEELDITKKLLEARKAGELADLEARKDGMAPDDFSASRKGIEDRYARGGIAADDEASQQTAAERERAAANLRIEADRKKREAAKIHIADADTDADNLKNIQAAAEAARKDKEERQKNLDRLNGMMADEDSGAAFRNPADVGWLMMRYGTDVTPDQASDIEKSGMSGDDQTIRTAKFQEQRMKQREKQRKKRDDLLAEAAAEEAKADELENTGKEGEASGKNKSAAARAAEVIKGGQTGVDETFKRGSATALAKAHGDKITKDQQDQLDNMNALIAALGMNGPAMIRAQLTAINLIETQGKELDAIHKQLAELKAGRKQARNHQ